MIKDKGDAPKDGVVDQSSVNYRSGCTAIALVFVGIAIVVFAFAAFDRSILLDLSEQRRAGWLSLLTIFEYGGINWAIVGLILAVLWECRKPILRLRKPVAVSVEGATVSFDSTTGHRELPLDAIEEAEHRGGFAKSELWLRTTSGERLRLRNVDERQAQAFAAPIEAGIAAD